MTAKGAPRNRADWPAIEAWHNTGKFSDSQLAAVFNVSRETIVRRRKADQAKDPRRWQKDLSQQVRQATAALLLRDQITAEASQVTAIVTDGHTAAAILTAAEVAKSVILQHREDLSRARKTAMAMLDELDAMTRSAEDIKALFDVLKAEMSGPELLAAQQQFRDFMRLHSRVGSVHKLADTLNKLQDRERIAYALDEKDDPKKPVTEMSDEQLLAKLADLGVVVQITPGVGGA